MPNRRVLIVAVPPAQELNVIGPLSVFLTANQHLSLMAPDAPRYAVELVSADASLKVNGGTGFALLAAQAYADVRGPIDTLLVAGGEGSRKGTSPEFLAWLKRRAKSVRRFGSLCSGAFVLADAGLLDGKRATLHWKYRAEFAKMYPGVEVEADRIWVYDKSVYTSAGVTSGVDLALAMVEEDHGSEIALEIARYLVMFLRRPSGQAQLSVSLAAQAADRLEFRDMAVWIAHHLHDDLRIEALAERVGMSDRNFTRMFTREVGMSPGLFVERTRLERARRELETSSAGIDEIADRCGYGGREALRRAFTRHAGVSPSEYRTRSRFKTQQAAS
jgi:transcriptional regulator GlxA family with amidase domain